MADVYKEIDDAFDIVLVEDTGDSRDSGVVLKAKHTIRGTNLGGEVQRKNLVDTNLGKDRLVVKCDMTQILHGSMTKGGSPATLVVFQFFFWPRALHARFKSAEVTLTFPVGKVCRIAPNRTAFIMQSTTTRDISQSVSPTFQIPGGFVTAGCDYTWEHKETTDVNHHGKIEGYIRTLRAGDKSKNDENSVQWSLWENKKTESGIPHFLQTALLLERNRPPPGTQEANFIAELSIVVELDTRSSRNQLTGDLKKTFGNGAKSCDVLFDPKVSRPEGLEDTDSLAAKDLDSLCNVWGYPDQVDGTKMPYTPLEKPKTLQSPNDNTPLYTGDRSQPIRGEGPSVGTHEPAVGQRVGTGLSDTEVQKPQSNDSIVHVAHGAGSCGAAADTEHELQEELILIRTEVELVKRLIDLTREERKLLGKLRQVQKM